MEKVEGESKTAGIRTRQTLFFCHHSVWSLEPESGESPCPVEDFLCGPSSKLCAPQGAWPLPHCCLNFSREEDHREYCFQAHMSLGEHNARSLLTVPELSPPKFTDGTAIVGYVSKGNKRIIGGSSTTLLSGMNETT